MSRRATPRDVEAAYDRFLDRAHDLEFDPEDGDDATDPVSAPAWAGMVDDLPWVVALALAFPPAWCLLGLAVDALA